MKNLLITPKTKIFELLEAYPQLEQVLIESAPPFKKLSNPILRKTISKITSLSQAALIGGLKVEELVNLLRAKAGQTHFEDFETEDHQIVNQKPEWFDEQCICKTIDIRDIINSGEQPVHQVMASIRDLKPGEIFQVIAPFLPAPLIDKSISMNYRHWLDRREEEEEEYRVYFTK